MKRLLAYLFIMLICSFKSFAMDGKGNVNLSDQAVYSFIDYIKGKTSKHGKSLFNKPLVFWVTIDGSQSYWWYCKYSSCTPGNSSVEKKACEKSTGLSCARFARGRYVRWDNGINPKGKLAKFNSKMTESEIKSKLTKLGFYNNNLQVSTETDQDNLSLISSKSLVEKLDDLSKLFENGLLTEEEFTKAKKKLLD